MAETAASFHIKEMHEQQQRRLFEYMARDFFEAWQPEDRDLQAQFSAELFTLIRQVFHDAVAPMTKQMTDLMLAMNNPMFRVS